MRRHVDGRHPLEAVAQVRGIVAIDVRGPDVVAAFRTQALVEDREAALAVGVDDVRVARLRDRGAGLAATGVDEPSLFVLGTKGRHARHGNGGAVVLLASIEPVGILVVHFDLIELGGGLIELGRPGLTAIESDVRAAVIRLHEVLRIIWIDPHVVAVSVRRTQPRPGHAAVDGLHVLSRHGVEDVRIRRIDIDVGVVEGTRADRRLGGDLHEIATLVHRLVQAALIPGRLDERVQDARIGRRHRQIDLADEALGQAGGKLLPAIAAVDGFVDASRFRRASADNGPGRAARTPGGRVDDIRIPGNELHVGKAHLIGNKEHLVPVRAPVPRAIDPALSIFAMRLTDRCDPDGVRIAWIDFHRPDMRGFREPLMGPGLAAINGLVDTLAADHVAAQAVRARTDVDNVGVMLCHGNVTDGGRVEGRVRHRSPARAVILCLPNAPARGAEVEGSRRCHRTGHRRDPTAPGRADVAVFQGLEQLGEHDGR